SFLVCQWRGLPRPCWWVRVGSRVGTRPEPRYPSGAYCPGWWRTGTRPRRTAQGRAARSVGSEAKTPGERHVGVRWRDAYVTLHLLVERGAEVRAVEGVDAWLGWVPGDRQRLPRLDEDVGVLHALHREAVRDVPVLLEVGHVPVDGVADPDAF